jgi:putative two-component system response regulator
MALRPMPVEPRGWHSNSAQSLAAESSSAGISSIILVVGPTVSGRRSVTAALKGLGHHFVEARDTGEALAYLAKNQVDLVIADLLVPDEGAAELCRAVRKSIRTSLLPVLLIGRYGHINDEVAAIDAGADAVLPQTIHPKALRASVQSALRRKAAVEALDETEAVLFTLAQSVEERDPALGQHCGRLALMAAAMGVALGLDRNEILALERGGYLHDVGKVAIPDSVLFKPGPLTPEEWTVMRSHTERGERICRNVRSLESVLPIIRHHHERWDGGGYPDKLKGEDIPLLARIIQLADIYDALTTTRPYKQAFSPAEALRIMQQETANGWRDPRLMKIFAELVPMFQNPNAVELSELSLQALATSLDSYRKDRPDTARRRVVEPIRMVSGL